MIQITQITSPVIIYQTTALIITFMGIQAHQQLKTVTCVVYTVEPRNIHLQNFIEISKTVSKTSVNKHHHRFFHIFTHHCKDKTVQYLSSFVIQPTFNFFFIQQPYISFCIINKKFGNTSILLQYFNNQTSISHNNFAQLVMKYFLEFLIINTNTQQFSHKLGIKILKFYFNSIYSKN